MPTPTRRRAARPVPMLARCPSCGRENVEAAPCPDECGRCNACCTCGGAHVEADSPNGSAARARGTGFHGEITAAMPRYASVEIEFNGMRRYAAPLAKLVRGKWKGNIVNDGSCGYEINTAPARGDKFEKQIVAICNLLVAGQATIDRRCGAHVHVDARDAAGNLPSFDVIKRLAVLWSMVERAMFDVVAPTRVRNDYCFPCGEQYVKTLSAAADASVAANPRTALSLDATGAQAAVERLLYGATGSAAQYGKRDKYGCHYRKAAMNLHSFFFAPSGTPRGTVEFRLHQGSLNGTKLTMFARLCASLVEWCHTHTDADLARLRGSAAEILDKVCPAEDVKAWRKRRVNHFRAERGVSTRGGADVQPTEADRTEASEVARRRGAV